MQEDKIDKIDEAIYAGAKVISRWLKAPGGGGSFDDAVIEHRIWFQGAQARGMKCPAIINVLYSAGIKRENGLPLSEGHVRGVLSRRQQKKIPSKEASLQALLDKYGPKPTPKRQGSVGRSTLSARKSDALDFAPARSQARRPGGRAVPLTEQRGAQTDGSAGKTITESKSRSETNRIRNVTKRAAALRQWSDKD